MYTLFKLEKKEIRKEYIRLQNELNTFVEDYSANLGGYENDLILTPDLQKRYDELLERIAELRRAYKS